MNREQLMSVLIAPHVTEKSSLAMQNHNQYTFRVRRDATKTDIRKAVELMFDVKVAGVQVVNEAGKRRRFGKTLGRTEDWKKAYVSLASGQTIDLAGLLCLFDTEGPCGNAVKDAQRTKTTAETRRTLSLIWGTVALPGRAAHELRAEPLLLQPAQDRGPHVARDERRLAGERRRHRHDPLGSRPGAPARHSADARAGLRDDGCRGRQAQARPRGPPRRRSGPDECA